MNLYLVYDKQGRLIREGQNENTYYYAYGYDNKGRRVVYTQRSAKGEFIQKTTTEYLEKDSLKKVSLYEAIDTTKPTHVYFYNNNDETVRDEYYANGKLTHLYIRKFNSAGEITYSYDSSASTVIIRKDLAPVKMRTYSPKNELLHDYTYVYLDYYVREIIDSVSPQQVTRYAVYYDQFWKVSSADRNGKKMSEGELVNFKKEFVYVLPRDYDLEDNNGLPPGELMNTHKLEYDKKGNITRDELTQTQGSYSLTYVYEYEYEFY